MLWYEAVEQLKAGRSLSAPARTRWALPGSQVRVSGAAETGWLLEDGSASAEDAVQHFERLEMALLAFERLVGQIGLIGAVAANRYSFLFPHGSSLGWPAEVADSERPRPLRMRLPHFHKVG